MKDACDAEETLCSSKADNADTTDVSIEGGATGSTLRAGKEATKEASAVRCAGEECMLIGALVEGAEEEEAWSVSGGGAAAETQADPDVVFGVGGGARFAPSEVPCSTMSSGSDGSAPHTRRQYSGTDMPYKNP